MSWRGAPQSLPLRRQGRQSADFRRFRTGNPLPPCHRELRERRAQPKPILSPKPALSEAEGTPRRQESRTDDGGQRAEDGRRTRAFFSTDHVIASGARQSADFRRFRIENWEPRTENHLLTDYRQLATHNRLFTCPLSLFPLFPFAFPPPFCHNPPQTNTLDEAATK